MNPKDVYVVYDSQKETIISVHSVSEFATLARKDLVNDLYNRLKVTNPQDAMTKSTMRYCVITLDIAEQWLSIPFKTGE